MANVISIQARRSTSSPSTALRAPILKPIPMLLAAVLVGCASNVQHHTSGALTGPAQVATPSPAPVTAAKPGYQPAPYEDPAVPSAAAAEETAPAPLVFKDEGGGEANDESTAQPERFEKEAAEAKQDEPFRQQPFVDEGAPAKDEAVVTREHFTDDAPAARDEGVVAQHFTDDAGPARDEAVVAQHFTDDAPPATDEGIAAHRQFTDDAAPAKDEDNVAQHRFTDDAAPAMDEDSAQQKFTDEAPVAKEEAIATEEYSDESAGAAPEEFARAPETFTDEKLTQAEEARSEPVSTLPLTVTVETDPLFDFDQYSIRAESRKQLDDLIQQLKGIPYGEIITVGFADPIGTQTYNQRLSKRRAASVERYLVSNGIPADKIRVEARGQTEEYASYKSCKGQGKQKLIACLQPDRRVEVTVTAATQQ